MNNISIVIEKPNPKLLENLIAKFQAKKEEKIFCKEYLLETPKKREYKKRKPIKIFLIQKIKKKENKQITKSHYILNKEKIFLCDKKKKYFKNINKKLSLLRRKRGRPKKQNSLHSETSVSSTSNKIYL